MLCDTCKGKDELEHYLVCPHGFRTVGPKLKVAVETAPMKRVMLVGAKSSDDVVLLASILYGLRGAVHKLRAQNSRAKPNESKAHIWEQIRIACAHHKGLSHRVDSIWKY